MAEFATIARRKILVFFILYSVCFSVLAADQFDEGMRALKKGDYAEAFCIWRPLAMQNHKEAAYHIGWLYANGNGLRVDISQAVYWWKRAAKQGHIQAAFDLGMAFTQGEGIEKDRAQALKWFVRAANAGHEEAQEVIRAELRSQSADLKSYLPELLTKPWIGQTVRVKVDKANLRSGPGTEYELLDMVYQNSTLIQINQRNKWLQTINPEGMSFGWIASWLIDPVH